MSFWKKAAQVAADLGTGIANHIEESANEIREIRQKLEQMSDDELLRIVHSDGFFGSNQKEKGIAFGILTRSRGMSADEINVRRG
jgi:hypothetical protein